MSKEVDERDGIDSDDPMAEVGPEQCSPSVADVSIDPGERSGAPHESQYSASDETDDAFQLEQLATPLAADGLPDHSADQVAGSEAHPFTIEHVCCIEDKRKYVELFNHELPDVDPATPGTPAARLALLAETLRLSKRGLYDNEGQPRERKTFDPDAVKTRWGITVAPAKEADQWVVVRPLRERCVFYKRQHFANDDQPDPKLAGHNIIYRNCTHPSRRSIGGASMSLSNEAIYGCDYREPRDDRCTDWMNKHDDGKVRDRPDLVRLPMFGMAGEEVHTSEETER